MILKKIKFCFILICIIAIAVSAYDFEFTPGVQKSLSELEKNSPKISRKIQNNLLYKPKNVKKISFQSIVEQVSTYSDSVQIDQSNNRVSYAKRNDSNKGISYADEESFSNVAYSFLDKLSNPLSQFEDRKTLYTKFEKSIHEELDANGKISKNTNLRVHSAVVKIGRMVHGYPIFNSYATIGVDAVDHHITYLDLNNWVGINVEPPENFIEKINVKKIGKRISDKVSLKFQEIKDSIDRIEIQETVYGWQLDNSGNIVPAVIFKGSLFKVNSSEIDEFTELELL